MKAPLVVRRRLLSGSNDKMLADSPEQHATARALQGHFSSYQPGIFQPCQYKRRLDKFHSPFKTKSVQSQSEVAQTPAISHEAPPCNHSDTVNREVVTLEPPCQAVLPEQLVLEA